jgi:hypothetical protein
MRKLVEALSKQTAGTVCSYAVLPAVLYGLKHGILIHMRNMCRPISENSKSF